MRKFARKGCQVLITASLAALMAACGSGREETISSSTSPTFFYSHSVAFRNNITFTWGINSFGQLGNGEDKGESRFTPQQVVGVDGTGMLPGIIGVSAGGTHTLAFDSNGSIFAWGNNGFGQVGDNTQTAREKPVRVVVDTGGTHLTGITAISAGANHSLALKDDQTVWAWGSNNEGQLGGTSTFSQIAVPVSSLAAGVTRIAAGGLHSLALLNGSTVQSWGSNLNGQLGYDTSSLTSPTLSSNPDTVVKEDNGAFGLPLDTVTKIAAGGGHSLFLLENGTVWACGLNHDGQLGTGTTVNRTHGAVPVQNLPTGKTPIAVAAGLSHSLALMSDGTVYAWGYNFYGQLGNPGTTFNTTNPETSPVQVMENATTPLTGVDRIVAIGHKSLAKKSDGSLWAWGDNSFGQLGIAVDDTTDRSFATRVTDQTGYDLYDPQNL